MATKKLPSPEEYGKALARRRQKADRVPLILKKLDMLAAGVAEQSENLQELPLSAIQEAIEGIRGDLQAFDELRNLQGLTDEDRRAIQAIESMQDTIIKAINALSDAILAMPRPAPAPKPTDLEPLMREIRGYRVDTEKQFVMPPPPQPVPLNGLKLKVISRDENGDIEVVSPIYN